MSHLKTKRLTVPGLSLAWIALFLSASSLPDSTGLHSARARGISTNGRLERGEVLPLNGQGYRILETTLVRRNRFGVMELVMMVKDAAFRVSRRMGGAPLAVGDLSGRRGGPLQNHVSHQNGLDVDFGFYVMDRGHHPVFLEQMIGFDRNGFSVEPPMRYRFDDVRNWELVKQLLQSKYARVQWIFVADHLKKRLLQHGESRGESAELLRRASMVLRQPPSTAHWDHFHVRIYCPDGHEPECRNFGPLWDWVR